MRSDALELGNSCGRQHHRPVRRIECWQQREPVVDQGLTVGDEKSSAVGHNRTHADKSLEVAARDLSFEGDTALVKLGGLFAGIWYSDDLSLVLIDNAWRIVHKTFYAHPKG